MVLVLVVILPGGVVVVMLVELQLERRRARVRRAAEDRQRQGDQFPVRRLLQRMIRVDLRQRAVVIVIVVGNEQFLKVQLVVQRDVFEVRQQER